MKRIYIILLMLVSVCSLSAQTEKAKSMYEEVVSGKITTEKFIKQDFAEVDSTSSCSIVRKTMQWQAVAGRWLSAR